MIEKEAFGLDKVLQIGMVLLPVGNHLRSRQIVPTADSSSAESSLKVWA
jgi:hypothetical protein